MAYADAFSTGGDAAVDDVFSYQQYNKLRTEFTICKLASVASIDMNPGSPPTTTTLYTVPTGKVCIVTHVVCRACSGNLTTAEFSFGFNAGGTDVIDDAAHTALTGSTVYEVIQAKAGAVRGAAADTFKIAVSVAQGGAMTLTVDVYGTLC